jgi:hypothetical protein
MPPILVIDDDGPTRAARKALLRRNGAVARSSSRLAADARAPDYDAMIADTCMHDTHSAARIRALMLGPPVARFVARSQAGVMAAILDTPDFQALADRLVK